MSRPLLLDLFCGAGGCAVGYHRAGFDVLGVDHRPQKRYPFAFVQADALQVLRDLRSGVGVSVHQPGETVHYDLSDFAAIHASPPCQGYSIATNARVHSRVDHPDLIEPTRAALEATGKPWVLENVERAASKMHGYRITLCGLMFALKVFRHRCFMSNMMLFAPDHPAHKGHRIGENGMVCVAGNGGQSLEKFGTRNPERHKAETYRKAAWSAAMGIDWMSKKELAQAIPPAYTEWIGRQLISLVRQ